MERGDSQETREWCKGRKVVISSSQRREKKGKKEDRSRRDLMNAGEGNTLSPPFGIMGGWTRSSLEKRSVE